MPTVGTDKISPGQERLLKALRDSNDSQAFSIIWRLTSDDDIRSGREEVHPDWISLYQTKRHLPAEDVPSSVIKDIDQFFSEIGPVIDEELARIDPARARLSFLLGAGVSKPSPSSIPTVKELLPQLLERGRRLDREDVTKLADFCESRRIDNIEDLLTAAQLATFSSRNPVVLRLQDYLLYGNEREGDDSNLRVDPWALQRGRVSGRRSSTNVASVAFLQDTLQVLFTLLASTMLPAVPNAAHESIATFIKTRPECAVITTNYDCCIDIAFEAINQSFTYCVDLANQNDPNNGETTNLIKLHGSLNWYYCETCQEIHRVDIRRTVELYNNDEIPYSVIAICRKCGGQRRLLLVPPLAMKFDMAPPLTPLIAKAHDAFEQADVIVVAGFSFADADLYITRMVSKSIQSNQAQRLLIFDPAFDLVNKVRRKFKSSIPNFDERRIIRVADDCSVSLPRFLTGQFQADGFLKVNAKAALRRGHAAESTRTL